MGYSHIEVLPVSGALGAEIQGVNLARPLSDDTFEELHRALLDYLVVFLRGQDMTPRQQIALGKRFGELDIHPYVAGMPDCPEIIHVIREPEDTGFNFGGDWHSDVTFQERPALGSILYAEEVPAYGGDTLFANQYLAYETLSDGMKSLLEGLEALHSASRPYGLHNTRGDRHEYAVNTHSMKVRYSEDAERMVAHPVVRTHPETGRKALYVNSAFTHRFQDLTKAESEPLLKFLIQHAARMEFTCRFRWEVGSVAFWDNRCVQHYALNDYAGQRRAMRRVTIAGDRPC